MTNGTSRIANIELDDTRIAPMPAAPTTVTTGGKASRIVYEPGKAAAGEEVSALARARIEGQQEQLARLGYKGKGTQGAGENGVTAWAGLAIGTRVNATGDENLTLSRLAFEEKPLALDGLERFASHVDGEGREHVEHVKLASLRCRETDGALAMLNGTWRVFDPSPRALLHLAGFLSGDRGLPTYLPNAPLPVRKAIVEEYQRQLAADEKRAGKEVTLGIRKSQRKGAGPDAPKQCYRIGGATYRPYEAHVAARDVMAGCADAIRDARTEVVYDGERARITFWFHADHVVDLAAGDVFKIGITLHLDDVRAGAIRVSVVVVRNMCLNLIVLGEQTKTTLVQRHVGKSVAEVAAKVRAAIDGSASDLGIFLNGWRAARQDRIIDAGGDPRSVFEGLVGAGLVKLPGNGPEQVEGLLRAWNKEPGYSRADFVNAVTRAAHEDAWWSDAFESEEVERAAGQLLYVKNIVRRIDAGRAVFAEKAGIELT